VIKEKGTIIPTTATTTTATTKAQQKIWGISQNAHGTPCSCKKEGRRGKRHAVQDREKRRRREREGRQKKRIEHRQAIGGDGLRTTIAFIFIFVFDFDLRVIVNMIMHHPLCRKTLGNMIITASTSTTSCSNHSKLGSASASSPIMCSSS
jgi:hypothetical protein